MVGNGRQCPPAKDEKGIYESTTNKQDLRLLTKELRFRETQELATIAQERVVQGAVQREASPLPAGVEASNKYTKAKLILSMDGKYEAPMVKGGMGHWICSGNLRQILFWELLLHPVVLLLVA